MPDVLSVAVTTGLGFSVLAGIFSGVCYILSYGLPRKRKKISDTRWNCSICGCRFRSIDGILDVDRVVVTCGKCKSKICKVKCARQDPDRGWICRYCQHTESWYGGLLKAIEPRNSSKQNWCSTNTMVDCATPLEIDEDLVELHKKEREQVRDFIERLVGAMLGGDLDNVSVKKLYNDAKYDALFSRYHNDLSSSLTDLGSALQISIANLPISGQTPCTSHAALKQLIQRFIQEAAELPKLEKSDNSTTPASDNTNDRTYEDLLSTAILNKVIQNYQEGEPSSSGSISSRTSTSSRKKCDKELFIGERNLSTKKNYDDASSTCSSLDEWVKSDSSLGSIKYVDPMSLTIKQRIDEVPSSGDEEERDVADFESVKSNDWEENWYLQKRKFKGANSPVPVPMLVPNPVVEAKVLIGDREAEDTTDLSDAASDFGDEVDGPPSLNAILVDSKNIIGGKNTLNNMLPSQEVVTDTSGTDTADGGDSGTAFSNFGKQIDNHLEASNDVLIKDAAMDDASMLSLDSNTEKDTEYTERFASLPRTILKSPHPTPRLSKEIKDIPTDKLFENGNEFENVDSGVTSDEDEKPKIFKGSYSEREKDKWNHGVELSHNPYSKNNLERRLSATNSTNSSILGRDYVIRESAKSAGSKHRLQPTDDEDENAVTNGSSSINTNENDVPDTAQATTEKIIESASSNTLETALFKAMPAMVLQEDASDMESSIEPQTPTRPNLLDISSDSDYSVERCYNLQTGEIVQKVGDVKQERIKETPSSPEGLKYTQKDFDENHNVNDTQTKKRQFLRSLTHDEFDDIINDRNVLENNAFILNDRKNSLDEDFATPQENHFKLVRDIANETSGEYNNVPISPPAEYKTHTHPMYKEFEHVTNKEAECESNNRRSSIKNDTFYQKDSDLPDSSNDHYYNNKETSYNSIESSDTRPDSSLSTDSEINVLKEKQIVKNLLGEFSKSFPNLSASQRRDENQTNQQNGFMDSGPNSIEIDEVLEEVKPIAKTTKHKYDSFKSPKESGAQVYSLTARSIPRQFRKELQKEQIQMIDPADIISSDAPEEDSDLSFPTARSKIDFFEKLK